LATRRSNEYLSTRAERGTLLLQDFDHNDDDDDSGAISEEEEKEEEEVVEEEVLFRGLIGCETILFIR
jgi:hypothetical protein